MKKKTAKRERDRLAKHLKENGDTIGLFLLGEIEKVLGLDAAPKKGGKP